VQHVAHVALDLDELVDVRLPELEIRVALEVLQVRWRAGDEVVEREDAVAVLEQRLAEV